MGRCQGEQLARAIEWFEWRVGIIPVRRVQWILWVVLVGGIERIVGIEPIRWIHWVPWIVAVCRVEGIVWRVSLGRVQRIIRRIPTGRVEDIVVALVLLREAWLGKCRCDGEEKRQRKEEYHPHSEPPTSGTTNWPSLLPA